MNRRRLKRFLMKKYGLTEEEAEGTIAYLEEEDQKSLEELENNPLPDLNVKLLLLISFGMLTVLSFIKWLFSLGSNPNKKGEKKKKQEELYF